MSFQSTFNILIILLKSYSVPWLWFTSLLNQLSEHYKNIFNLWETTLYFVSPVIHFYFFPVIAAAQYGTDGNTYNVFECNLVRSIRRSVRESKNDSIFQCSFYIMPIQQSNGDNFLLFSYQSLFTNIYE
ncbi:MAG: hypothetical protein BGP14_11945 [Sphingobacteriales bacterium 44-15]|nr:MAG: hypothetical protein BGP14_11945 [Sphingobacteriales bacterium 44-15]